VVKIALDVGFSLNRRTWTTCPLTPSLPHSLTCLLALVYCQGISGLTPLLTHTRTSPARTTSLFLWLQAARHPRTPF
jgi:hypothetical protein